MSKRINNNIHELWKKSGMPLEELAHGSGISLPHLKNLKAGNRKLNQSHIDSLARVLGVKPSEIVGDIEKHSQSRFEVSPEVLNIKLSDVEDIRIFCTAAIRLAEMRDMLDHYRRWTPKEREERLQVAITMAEELKKEEAKKWLEEDNVIETLRLRAS